MYCNQVELEYRSIAARLDAREVPRTERGVDEVPFQVIPVAVAGIVSSLAGGPGFAIAEGSGGGSSGNSSASTSGQEQITAEILAADLAAAEAQVAAQAQRVRELKQAGHTNQSEVVQHEVQVLLRLKQQLQALVDAVPIDAAAPSEHNTSAQQATAPPPEQREDVGMPAGEAGDGGNVPRRREVLPDDHPYATLAIWQLPPRPLYFEAERPLAKELAKHLASFRSLAQLA
jgi:hypothetical protein